jgi:putative intracellular protease/amidase
MPANDKAVIVVTSHDKLGETGRRTGFYFDEMAAPYWALVDAGYDVEIASITGGAAPWDPGSYGEGGKRPVAVQRFIDDQVSMEKLRKTHQIAALDAAAYRSVFLPGGHGTMWDFTDAALASFIGRAWDQGAVVGAVCHGPAGLVQAVKLDGTPLVRGLRVNSFTDTEEAAVKLTEVVPFLLETELRAKGARFEATDNFQAHAVRDGRLVTGQNPRSVARVAELLVEALSDERRAAA